MARKRKKVSRVRGGATFSCPKCHSVSRVTRTKRDDYGDIARERVCTNCGKKFVTIESKAA